MLEGAELEPIKAAVVSSTLDGIIMIDQDGCVLALNPAAESMFGYSREEALGRPVADLIIPEPLREAHRRGLAAYLAGGEPKVIGKRIEVEAVRKDGRPIPIELTVLEIKVDDRRIFSATVRDRSEDAAQEEELELVRRRLELAIAGAQLGVWSFNIASGSAWFSDRARDLLGLDGNILAKARDFKARVHPDDWAKIVGPQFEDFPDEPRGIEYRVMLPDGGVRWIYSLGAAEHDERGNAEAVHGIIFDISDRKKAEDELESTRHQLELAVEGAQMGVWSYNPHDGSCWFSDRSRALWGLDRNFIANARELESVIHPDDRARSAVRHYDMFPDEPLAAEYRIVRPDGEVRWIYALGAAIRDEDGAFEAVHGIHLDITDRKRAEEELEGTRKHLELAVEGAQLGVWSFNPVTGKSWFSDRAREMLGLEDNFLSDSEEFRKRMHPADRGQLAFDRSNGFPEGPVASEYRVYHADGEMRWIFSLGAAVRDENDVAQAIYGIMDDITDRKQAEDDLESARRQLELAVEGAKLGVWSLDPRTGTSWFSDRAKELIGLDSNTLESPRDYKKFVHPDDWKQLTSPYADGFPDASLGIEYRIVRPDGEVRWIYGLGAAERDETGETEAVHGVMLDITDRKQADEELELMRRRLELALEGAQLGIWSFNPEKGSCWFSDHSKAMLGLPDNVLASARELQNYVHPDDWEALSAPYYSRYPDEPLPMEFRVPIADGGTRWIYALGAAIRDEAGELEAIHGIHLDVTARKQADEEFELMRRRLELAMNGAKIGIWSFNPETGAIWYSQRSREIYALDPDEPIETPKLRARVHPDDWAKLSAPYYDGFPDEPVEIEYRVVQPEGDVRWVYALGAAARGSDGVAHTVHGIHIDVTDRKRAEEELGRSRDSLLQSEKLAALGALLAGVSHELNNPLAAIVGQAEMLAEDSQGTDFEARATRIGAAAERCARIVQTFLTMARQGERQTAMVNLNEVIATALELTDYSLRTSGIAVRVNFGSGLPPIEGDRDQLHQVLVNLIVNAQQAMEKGEAFEKVLTIRTSINQAGRVLVDVTDTGPGVPEEMRHRIFEPFFTTKRQSRGGGTGIGLSFSQGIVTAHGGTLTVEPSRRGAHFRIELPAAAGEPITLVPREEMVIAEIVPDRRRCLVVEDEPDVAETLRELIEREGFEVTLAANGTEAFFALDKGDYDLLFSDLRMPLLNGPELYERLLEIRPELVKHMAFVTGDTMGDSMGEFARNCGRPILEKPFTRAGVRAVLAALVDKA